MSAESILEQLRAGYEASDRNGSAAPEPVPEATEGIEAIIGGDPGPPELGLAEAAGPASSNGQRPPGGPLDDLTLAEIIGRELPPERWIIPDLIAPSTISYLHGLPQTFKSFIALNVGIAVARAATDPGTLVLGKLSVEQGGAVGYIWQDDSEVEEMRRIQTVARAVAAEPDLPMFFLLNRGLRVDTEEGLRRLRAWIEHRQPILVVLDSLKDFVADGSTKDDAWVMRVNNGLKALCDGLGVALLILHHDSKPHGDTKGRSAGQTMHGSVFMEAGARSGLHCARPDVMKPEVRISRWGNSGKHWGPDVLRLDEETCELELLEIANNAPKVTPDEYLDTLREIEGGGAFVSELARRLEVSPATAKKRLEELPGVVVEKRQKGGGSKANFARLEGEQDALL
jgi:hypothetical protein